MPNGTGLLELGAMMKTSLEPSMKETISVLDKEVDERFNKAYVALVEYFINKYKGMKEYEKKSEAEIREIAEAEAKKWLEQNRATAWVMNTVLYVFSFLAHALGFALGVMDNARERGVIEANRVNPVRLADLSVLIHLYFKGKLSFRELKELARKLGFDEGETEKIVEASKPLLTPERLLELWRREAITPDLLEKELKKHGYDETQIGALLETATNLLSADVVRALWLRGEIDTELHDTFLRKLGYTQEQVELLKKLYYYIPSIPDLIRLAVREAFSPEAIEKFRLHEDYPKEFEQWAMKQGLSPYWCRAYWAAHWELPSLTMGYEMLHRRIISREELELLMRMQDISPFWRDKLIKLSYAPYTRVDVRRMYREGVISEKEVFETYLDLGYDEEHARNLTEWTIREATSDERKLIEKIVNEMIEQYSISEEEAIKTLVDAGYREEVAELKVQVMVLKRHNDWLNKVKNRIKKLYLIGIYDEDKAATELNKLNVPAREVSALLYLWELEKETSVKRLSEHDLEEAYKYNIISYDKFIEELRHLGYTEEDAKIKADTLRARR